MFSLRRKTLSIYVGGPPAYMTQLNHSSLKPNSCAHSFHSLFSAYGGQPPRWPQWFPFLVFTLLYNSLFFWKQVEQKWWEITSEIRSIKNLPSMLSYLVFLLACSVEASCAIERLAWWGTEDVFQLTAGQEPRPSVWQPSRSWILAPTTFLLWILLNIKSKGNSTIETNLFIT